MATNTELREFTIGLIENLINGWTEMSNTDQLKFLAYTKGLDLSTFEAWEVRGLLEDAVLHVTWPGPDGGNVATLHAAMKDAA